MRGLVALGSVLVALVAGIIDGWLGLAAVLAGAGLEESIRYALARRKAQYDPPALGDRPPWAYTRTGEAFRPEDLERLERLRREGRLRGEGER
jgi:hypothetical protein